MKQWFINFITLMGVAIGTIIMCALTIIISIFIASLFTKDVLIIIGVVIFGLMVLWIGIQATRF